MGISAQRLHRRKAAGAVEPAVAPALPPLIPREQHQRALQELRRGYELKLGAAEARIAELEESNARLAGALAEPDESKGKSGKGARSSK